MLTVRAYPADEFGCGHYRMRQPIQALRKLHGNDVTVFMGDEGLANLQIADTDVIVLQRPMDIRLIEYLIPLCQSQGAAVVVEVDDDYSTLHPNNQAFSILHPKTSATTNFNLLHKACAMADLVIVTTPALVKRYAGHGRYAVIPNYIGDHWFDLDHTGDGRTLGWPGWIGNHPDDLYVLGPSITQSIDNLGVRFLVLGDVEEKLAAKVLGVTDSDFLPWATIDDHPRNVGKLDVGIVPLADTAFNQAKSCLKLMEYSALGVYPVVSPSTDNLRLIDEYGITAGVAKKPKDWRREIARGFSDPSYRQDVVDANRSIARAELGIDRNVYRYLDAWSLAKANRSNGPKVPHPGNPPVREPIVRPPLRFAAPGQLLSPGSFSGVHTGQR